MATEPDPRTAPDEPIEGAIEGGANDDATNDGVSATDPAEGDDDAPAADGGSPG